jgi:hypothetical protein
VEHLPPAGIPMDACVYQIGAAKVEDTTFVTFTGKNLNSYGDSKLSGPDGFQESLLKALYRALEDKRKLICDAYGEFIEKCGGVVKKIPAEKIETIREMKNKYDQLGKRIVVLDTRIERLNSAVVADNLILQKGTLFFHYLNNQWGWFMNSNGDKFEGKYFGEIVGLKPHGKGTTTYPNGFKSGDEKVELVGEWKEGEPWNITRYNKSGEITGKWANGVMTDKGSVVMEKSQQGILFVWYVKCDYRNIIESSCVKINSSRSSYIYGKMKWSYTGNSPTYFLPSGDEMKEPGKYVGQIENGKPNGQGTLTWKNNEYVGEWKDGKRNGQGIYTWGKNKYVGELKDGKYWNGTWYGKDGNIHGKSVNGKFTKK